MRECDVLIVGGGTGGVAAALAVTALGLSAILTEETDWVGGQLTAQAVPPDEHPWIDRFGCTVRYRSFRERVRDVYRAAGHCSGGEPFFNPGGGWVSNFCIEPNVAHSVITEMLAPAIGAGLLEVRLNTVVAGGSMLSGPPICSPASHSVNGDYVEALALLDLRSGQTEHVKAKFFLDATELGDLLPLTGTEFETGSEGDPSNQQALTWVFAMAYDEGSHRVIDRPASYDRWKAFSPPFKPGPWLELRDLDPRTNKLRIPPIPLFSDDWRSWFSYRQVFDPGLFDAPPSPHPVTIVNWPQNDYFLGEIVNVDPAERWARLQDARELSACLLYWLQTEVGYPGLYASPASVGTADGFAKTPYIRESRRIVALHKVQEQDVSAAANPERDRAPEVRDSVGVGAYRLDLHPSTCGDAYLDLGTLPFQIPLGSLIPVRTRNLLPACKNLGVTHVTNGCYRLHPVEWNIGESAGLLAAFCVREGLEPAQIHDSQRLTEDLQSLLHRQGIETHWPRLHPL